MNFYRTIAVLLFTISSFGQKQFVAMNSDKIQIERAGDLTRLVIPFNVEDGYYIQDFAEVVGNVIPTHFSINDNSGFEKIEQELGATEFDNVKLDKLTHRVIKNGFAIDMILRLNEYTQYPEVLQGELFYQTCNSRRCFFPRTLKFEVSLVNLK